MDSHTKRRLVWSFLSATVARLAQTAIQFVQVPVFLHFWSVPLYGEWLILNSIPTYLWFSNAGFGNVAGNEMTMLVAGGDRDAAMRVFQSCWWLIVAVCGAFTAGLSVALYFLPVAHLLRLTSISEHDTKWILFWLALSILLAALEQLLQSAYRSIGRYPYGTFVKSVMAIVAFACTIIPVVLGKGPLITAEVYAAATIGSTVFLAALVKHDIPWIEYGWRYARFAEIRRLFRPAVAFMAFPVGQSLNMSGPQFALQYVLGPYAVVVFTTARQVSRGALQMVQMVNSTFEPEMTLAYGAKNIELTRSLHRRACQAALIVALVLVAGVMTVGPYFLHAWTGGHVPPSRGLLTVLLVGVVIYALWSTSSTLMTATNQHQRLAVIYLAATAVTCAACFAGAWVAGLYGAAAALLLAELAMNFYVLPASLRIAHDTFPAFLASMRHYPESLRPGALLARLRRRPEVMVPKDIDEAV
ncbi:MAG TPA: lipopolysaccharide biosynthesis protein [Acidobacteriaceae bacterium]|jgi:O-antigen/teichoic acid export membrane protein|nr:lipopolysaccharide biosynthesis protein [Acidobacteriaceae bacterium]